MSPHLHALLILLHLLGVIVWVGGMVFTLFVLRPAAIETLEPPKRLALLSAALKRFFSIVTMAVVIIIVSGLTLMMSVSFARAPIGWHLMLAFGLIMALVFAFIRVRLFPRLQASVQASQWSNAAASLDSIRKWVLFNLCVGLTTVAVAVMAKVG